MRCEQQRTKCIFCRNEKCDILNDTHFKNNKPCPFYKERLPEIVTERYFGGTLYRSIRGYNGKYFVSEQADVLNHYGRRVKVSVINRHLYVALKDDQTQKILRKSLAKIMADTYVPGTGNIGFYDGDTMNCERWNLYRVGDE